MTIPTAASTRPPFLFCPGCLIAPLAFRPRPTQVSMVGSAAELKLARRILGRDPLTTARALRLAGTPEKLAARVLDMEAGKRDISGPVQVAMKAFLSGWRPNGWTETAAS